MAEPTEAGHPAVTAADPVAGLFGQLYLPDQGLPWLADRLIEAAIERTVLLIEEIPTPNYERVLYILSDPPVRVGRSRIFRSLLAYFAGIGRKETGADVNPYGGRFKLVRESPSGPGELYVDFMNTTGMQRLQIVFQPTSPPHAANGAAAQPTPAG
jgi:hypothetical protein